MEAVRTSETSIENHFTRQYIPEDNSEHHTRRRENLKSHTSVNLYEITWLNIPEGCIVFIFATVMSHSSTQSYFIYLTSILIFASHIAYAYIFRVACCLKVFKLNFLYVLLISEMCDICPPISHSPWFVSKYRNKFKNIGFPYLMCFKCLCLEIRLKG
jgi:hypothetical protein